VNRATTKEVKKDSGAGIMGLKWPCSQSFDPVDAGNQSVTTLKEKANWPNRRLSADWAKKHQNLI
jgi:hypothetical protein